MTNKKNVPFLIKVHNASCPVWLSNIAFLKKIEPGCGLAARYEETAK